MRGYSLAAGRGGHGGGGAVGALREGAGEATDGERQRRSGGERGPAGDAGRDRRPEGAAATRSTRRSPRPACWASSSPTAAASAAAGSWSIRDGETGEITTIDSRETAPAAMVPTSFFIDGKAPTDAQFPINRYSGLSRRRARHARAWDVLLRRYGTYSLERGARPTASTSRAAASPSTRRSSTRRRPTRRTSTTSRRPRRSTSTPTARRATSAPSSRNPDMAKTYELMGRCGAKALLQRPDRRRDRQGGTTSPLAPDRRPHLAARPDDRRATSSATVIQREPVARSTTAATTSTAWARRPRAARPSSRR